MQQSSKCELRDLQHYWIEKGNKRILEGYNIREEVVFGLCLKSGRLIWWDATKISVL